MLIKFFHIVPTILVQFLLLNKNILSKNIYDKKLLDVTGVECDAYFRATSDLTIYSVYAL